MLLLVYNAPAPFGLDRTTAEAEQDVLQQLEFIEATCCDLDLEVKSLALELDLRPLYAYLTSGKVRGVFNLVESLGGSDRLQTLVPWLLESLAIPYSGCSAPALQLLLDKVRVAATLQRGGFPSPLTLTLEQVKNHRLEFQAGWFICKPIFEHASYGITQEAIKYCESRQSLIEHLLERTQIVGVPMLTQTYIEGREINVSLLAQGQECPPQILPLAEIDFSQFPTQKRSIVCSDAKWNKDSFAYHHTPRRFLDESAEPELIQKIESLCLACWEACNLRGFARIDLRIDENDSPWIIDINPNPCLSPDAGFVAAVSAAGISFSEALRRILIASHMEGLLR